MTDLFSSHRTDEYENSVPLAERMRPFGFDNFFGQKDIVGENSLLRKLLKNRKMVSLIFYGPPGTGKTTLAGIISKKLDIPFVSINAVCSNVSGLKRILDSAKKKYSFNGEKTVLFIDEIHRFNKAQQDLLMPYVESGEVILIGATTHNPAFALNSPLLSRSVLFEFKPLSEDDILAVINRALADKERGLGKLKIDMDAKAKKIIAKLAKGDARRAMIALEVGVLSAQKKDDGTILFSAGIAEEAMRKNLSNYDKDGDYHYDIISAFIKSMRGSDPDAAIYWLARMIKGGEDPMFIFRRMLIFASEDIGNADPYALTLVVSAMEAFKAVGFPEGRIIISQAVIYLARAPKSNSAYRAIDLALEDVKNNAEEVPLHLKDTHYFYAKEIGRGKGYKYPHNYEGGIVEQSYRISDKKCYFPSSFEKAKVSGKEI